MLPSRPHGHFWNDEWTLHQLLLLSTGQDDYPLASLPLLGYSVTIPAESENIHKDYVFKLHFKSHVYYFRSESEYTFERWAPAGGSGIFLILERLTVFEMMDVSPSCTLPEKVWTHSYAVFFNVFTFVHWYWKHQIHNKLHVMILMQQRNTLNGKKSMYILY